jgi:hypothetical protein
MATGNITAGHEKAAERAADCNRGAAAWFVRRARNGDDLIKASLKKRTIESQEILKPLALVNSLQREEM